MQTRRGRPPAFDRAEVLDRATLLFWQHGYEATSVKLLTSELGITASSLYAAFGDKEHLFLEVVDHYRTHYQRFIADALQEDLPGRASINNLLHRAVDAFTSPDHPRGCLIASATAAVAASSEPVQRHLAHIRSTSTELIRTHVARSHAEGDTPETVEILATYAATLLQGLSALARDGVSAETLHKTVDLALT